MMPSLCRGILLNHVDINSEQHRAYYIVVVTYTLYYDHISLF